MQKQLSPQQCEVFILRYQVGPSLKDIARRLKRSTSTVKSHPFRARKRLQEGLLPYLRSEPSEGSA
ncbi:sigma-70 family RNA polymerase sigma factor [Candidatus Poribacteria bacterium]|nr:sigma-70 family RNA polymerase sigma factor [Candidatus Poribacteria bacterium]